VVRSVSERTSLRALAGGGTILALASLAANGGNYLLNLFLGRWLTQSEFADANLMVTVMLLITAVAVSLQLVAARFAGIHAAAGTDERADVLVRWLERRSLAVGGLFALVLAGGSTMWADFFKVESNWPFVILGLGMPFYLAQAVGRGLLQGRLAFAPLAISFIVEMVVRVGFGVGLVAFGFGVSGATVGLSLSFVATWLAVEVLQRRSGRPKLAEDHPTETEMGKLRSYIGPVAILLLGQIIINNGDVLVVKRLFDGDQAGVYAAVALIGRAVFFLSWSAVTTLFPAVAQREQAGESVGALLVGGVATVAGLCTAMTLGVWVLGDVVLTGVFGPSYAGVGGLLTRYAVATSLFAVANVMVSHHLSSGRSREAWILLAGGVFQTALLLTRNGSMEAVVGDQIVAMGVLLAAVTVSSWDELARPLLTNDRSDSERPGGSPPIESQAEPPNSSTTATKASFGGYTSRQKGNRNNKKVLR